MIDELTERELELVAGVASVLTNQGIGNSLDILVETVKTHVVDAKDKLGAADLTQLAVMALLYGRSIPSADSCGVTLFGDHRRDLASFANA